MPAATVSRGLEQIYSKAWGPGVLANTDLTNPVYVGITRQLDTSSDQIPPLGAIALDGSRDYYASSLNSGITVVVQAMPGATSWSPSPAQIQEQLNTLGLAKDTSVQAVKTTLGAPAQDGTVSAVETAVNAPAYGPPTHTDVITTGPAAITGGKTLSAVNTTLGTPAQTGDVVTTLPANIAATGAPPLILHNQTGSLAATAIAVGSSNTSAAMAITQPAYEIIVSMQQSAATGNCVAHVRLDWSDSASGLLVDQDNFWLYPANTGGTAHVIRGRGPTKGNQVKVFVATTSGSANPITFAYQFFQSSRLWTAQSPDLWFTVTVPSGGYAAVASSAQSDAVAREIASVSQSVAATGGTLNLILPLFTGPVWIKFATTSAAADALFEIDDLIDTNITQDTTVYKAQSDATGRINVPWVLPRTQCQLTLTNNNANLKTLSCHMVAV